MDKRETGKTITIKINGKQQSFEETRQKSDRKQNHFIDDWKDKAKTITEKAPLQQSFEKSKPEKIPKKDNEQFATINETAVAHDPIEESFDWILPETAQEDPEINEYKIGAKSSQSKKKSSKKWPNGKRKIDRRMFTTIFTAVFLAILLGTSFGFIMLKLVFSEKPVETGAVQHPAMATPEPEQKPPQNQSGKLSLVVPPISTWVVQEGVYKNKDSAKQMVNSLKEKGVPAAIFETNGQSFLLLSVADTKDHAKVIGANLKESGASGFIPKEMSFGSKEVSGLQEQEKVYIEGIPLLFETITTASAAVTVTDSLPKTLLNSINQQAEKLDVKVDKAGTYETIKVLKGKVDAAVKSINSLQKSVDKQELTALQQQLLAILLAYQAL